MRRPPRSSRRSPRSDHHARRLCSRADDWRETRPGDRIFSGTALAAGLTILVTLVAVFVFLTVKGIPGFSADPDVYGPSSTDFWGYAGKLLFGTILAAVIA